MAFAWKIKFSREIKKVDLLLSKFSFLVVIILLVTVALEILLIPTDVTSHLLILASRKEINSVLFIQVAGFNFTIASLMIFFISILAWFFILLKLAVGRKLSTITPGIPKVSQVMLLYFILGCLLSIFLGVINPQPGLLTHLRNVLSLGFFFFLIITIKKNNEKKISKFVLVVLFIVSLFSTLSFLLPPFANWYSQNVVMTDKITTFQSRSFHVSTGAWSISSGTISLLLYSLALSRLLLVGVSPRWLLLCLTGAVGGLAFIGKKNVFLFIVITSLFFGLGAFREKKYFYRLLLVAGFVLMIILCIVIVYPSEFSGNIISFIQSYFLKGYLNIDRKELSGDLSSGRFEAWRLYILDSLKGLGMAPYGFGNVLDERLTAHNMIIHFAYHVGILPTVALFISVLVLLVNVLKKSLRLIDQSKEPGWRAIGYLFFFGGFLAQGMVSTNWFVYDVSFFAFLSLSLAIVSTE